MSPKIRILGFVSCLVLLAAVGHYMWLEYNRAQPTAYQESTAETGLEDTTPETALEEETIPEYYYPVGELIDTPDRNAYVDGDIVLQIPRMQFQGPVLDGTTDEVLAAGVGLFEQSQLPGPMERNGNVSIAGHRDVFGMEFYEIDKMTIGDEIIIAYQGNTYIYIVEQSFVTYDSDWEPIKVREYPCVTLQSCTPIGTAVDRIFVVGRLRQVLPGINYNHESAVDDAGNDAAIPDNLTETAEPL